MNRHRSQLTQGLSLLEVVIASSVLTVMFLIVTYSLIGLQKANTDTLLNTDVDQTARRALLLVRRDLRQTGKHGAVDKIAQPLLLASDPFKEGQTLEFWQRTDLTGVEATDWGAKVRYQRQNDAPPTFKGVPGTINRYKLVRTELDPASGAVLPGRTTVVAHNLSAVNFRRDQGDSTVLIELEVLRPNPQRGAAGAPQAPIRRMYRERVSFKN